MRNLTYLQPTRAGNMRLAMLLSSAMVITLPAQRACAQAAPDQAAATSSDQAANEIVVTAQKSGAERLRDVPISISVLSGAALDANSAQTVNDAVSKLPGVAVTQSSQGNGSNFSIRGVTASPSLLSASSTVGYYLDDVPFTLVRTPVTPDASPYDLDRVEVLKGPQGTLYGAGGLAGVVRVLTANPDPSRFEVKGQAGISTTEDGGTNYKADGAINIPLIQDKLAIRGVVSYEDLSGWVDQPARPRQNYNSADFQTYRFKVLAQPSDRLSAIASVWISRSKLDGLNASFADMTTPSVIDETAVTNYDIYGLNISYKFDSFAVESSTSHIKFLADSVIQLTPSLTPERLTISAKTFTQEVRAYSTTTGPWSWSIGASYKDASDDIVDDLVPALPFAERDGDKSRSIALFGEIGRKFANDTVELKAGLRYFHDKVDYASISSYDGPAVINSSATFKKVTPRVVASWRPSNQINLYASYAQGFRSGFNQNVDSLIAAPTLGPVKPDTFTNYELGSKGKFGAFAYELAVYYQDWKDPQLRQFVNIGTPTVPLYLITPTNGTRARGFGVDAAINVSVTRDFSVGGSLSWNRLSFASDVYSQGIRIYDKGDRLDGSPEYTGSVYLDYSLGLGAGYKGVFSGSANYVSRLTTKNAGTGVLFAGDSLTTAAMSFTIKSPKSWSVKAFVNNLTNEYGAVRPTTSRRQQFVTRLRPRTVGVLLSFNY